LGGAGPPPQKGAGGVVGVGGGGEPEKKKSAAPPGGGGRGGGGGGVQPKFRRPSKIVPNSTQLRKLLKIAEFRMPIHQDVRKKGSKILKLPRFTTVLH